MASWSTERFQVVTQRSQALHGNRYVLPVAVVIAGRMPDTVKAPEIGVALGGQLPPNRVLDALVWLCGMEVLAELPFPGRPAPRLFETRPSVYWRFVGPFSKEGPSDTARKAPRGGRA